MTLPVIGKIIETLKLGPRYLFAVVVASGLLLFLPESAMPWFGLDGPVEQYRSWIGGAFVVSSSFLGALGIAAAVKPLKREITWHLFHLPRGIRRLKNATPDESRFLANYLLKESRTQYAPMNSGLTSELEGARIIRRASNLSTYHVNFAYNIQPWAWDYLKKHPETVGISEDQIGSENE